MTQINFNFGALTASGVGDVSGIPVTITPTNRFTTSDGRSVLVKTLSIALDEHGAGSVTVPETVDGKYAYRVSVGDPADSFAFVRVVKVPAADSKNTPVSFDSLQDVDLNTLAPVVQSALNDQAKSIITDMQAKQQSLADATVQAQTVVDDLAKKRQTADDAVKAINDTKTQVDAAKAAVDAAKAAVDAAVKSDGVASGDAQQDADADANAAAPSGDAQQTTDAAAPSGDAQQTTDAAAPADDAQSQTVPTVPAAPAVPTVQQATEAKA